MNRYHFIIIYALVISGILAAIGVLSYQTMLYREDSEEITTAVETSIYSATIEMRNTQSGNQQSSHIVSEYFRTLSLITGKITQELYSYTPVIVIMQNDGFYLCYYSATGFVIPDHNALMPYTNGQVTVQLDSRTSWETVTSCVRLSIEDAVNARLLQYGEDFRCYTEEIDLNMDIAINPSPSILVVLQNYPLPNSNRRYSCVYQSAGQIKKR